MVKTRLEILDESQAIAENIPISIDFVLADVREPDKRNASFSKTIRLFATNEINKLFENIYQVNISTQYFNKNLKTPCKYFVNDLLNFSGSLQLIKIVLAPDGNIIYECSIIGEGGALFIDIGDKYITGNADGANDLDFSAYDHTYDRDTQIALNTANVTTGLDVLYPFIDRGSNGGLDDKFDVEDFLPCLSFWEYWNKIFTMAGYTYTSTIIDSAEFKKYIMLPNIINVPLDSTQINNSQFYLGEDGLGGGSTAINIQSATKYVVPLNGAISTSPFFDTGSQYNNATYAVTLNENGRYNIAAVHDMSFLWSHTNPVVVKALIVGLKIKSMTEYSTDGGSTWNELCAITYDWKNQPVSNTLFDTDFTVSYASGEVSLQAGTLLRHTIELNQMPTVGWYDGVGNQIFIGTGTWDVYWNSYNGAGILGTQFYGLLTSKNITTGQTMKMNNALPVKIKQRDFVKSVIQALNLYIEPDKLNPKHLTIESYSDFYDGDIINFENRTDLDKEQTINPNLLEGKRYIWRYKQDNDYYNKLYFDTFQEPYGTETIIVDSDFKKEDKVNEIIFSPTPNVANYMMGIAMPRIYSYENSVYKPIAQNVRWLYCEEYKTAPGAFTYTDSFDTDLITDQYLYAGHTDDPFNPTLDLSFGEPKAVYYNFIAAYYTNNNLYNRYQKTATDNVISVDSKFVTKYLWLTPKDINTFSFRHRWFIDGAYYIVNRIVNYDATKEDSILCELIKLLESEVFTPSSVLLASAPNIDNGATITLQTNNTSLTRGANNINRGVNSIVVGNNNLVPSSANNITIFGNNVAVAEDSDGFALINNTVLPSIVAQYGAIRTVTANYNVKFYDSTILVDATSGNITIDLSIASTSLAYNSINVNINGTDYAFDISKIITIKKIDSTVNTVTLDNLTNLIDGATTQVLTNQYEALTIQWDGTDWYIL